MAKTKNPIPPDVHSVTPYLLVKDARKAISFYREAFGAEEISVMEISGKVMHARIKIGDSLIFMGEEYPEMGILSAESRGFATNSLMIYVQDVDSAFERATKAGCTVRMPVSDMFWGDRYGNLTDPFGQEWALATHKEDLTDAEIEANFKEMSKHMAGCK